MRATVLLNAAAGTTNSNADAIQNALRAAGVEPTIRPTPGDQLAEAAKAAASEDACDAVIAAGGDGTISTVAGALANQDTPLGVLPVGTLNHFAKDLGLPLDLAAAARVIADGNVERIDVAAVNGRTFINNSSLGVYAHALIDRDVRRKRHGWSKWPAMFAAALKIFKRRPLVSVTLEVDGRPLRRKTPLIFVGNNCYELDLLHVGKRACLTDGALSLYIANTHSRWGMLKLALRAALGQLKQSRDFETFAAKKIQIESNRHALPVALDGEITKLNPPLTYEIHTRALPVLVRREGEAPDEP